MTDLKQTAHAIAVDRYGEDAVKELIVPSHRKIDLTLAQECEELRQRCDWLEGQIEAIRHFANMQPSASWASLAMALDEATEAHRRSRR